ncbi:MAG: hypothetical protein J3K34DRAFT_403809 [Monoraphidium minutum]|nr:MAG: hypothetical protein J3K34DRAFT_403809 [Monoraphidium minutum]
MRPLGRSRRWRLACAKGVSQRRTRRGRVCLCRVGRCAREGRGLSLHRRARRRLGRGPAVVQEVRRTRQVECVTRDVGGMVGGTQSNQRVAQPVPPAARRTRPLWEPRHRRPLSMVPLERRLGQFELAAQRRTPSLFGGVVRGSVAVRRRLSPQMLAPLLALALVAARADELTEGLYGLRQSLKVLGDIVFTLRLELLQPSLPRHQACAAGARAADRRRRGSTGHVVLCGAVKPRPSGDAAGVLAVPLRGVLHLPHVCYRRMSATGSGILRAAFLENLTLAQALRALPRDRDPSRRVWSGAWLHALGWLAAQGGSPGDALRAYLEGVYDTLAAGAAALAGWHVQLKNWVSEAWDHALADRTAAAVQAGGGARAEYAAHFAVPNGQGDAEPGFPSGMPQYFRHTSRFRNHQHARALMRLRCCSPPVCCLPHPPHGWGHILPPLPLHSRNSRARLA